MCHLELSVCGDCGKGFVCYKRGKEKHQLRNNQQFMIAVVSNTHTLTRQSTWTFVVKPGHGGESTLEGKDCVHAYNINSSFNVISDSGMHVVVQKLLFVLGHSFNSLPSVLTCSAIHRKTCIKKLTQ